MKDLNTRNFLIGCSLAAVVALCLAVITCVAITQTNAKDREVTLTCINSGHQFVAGNCILGASHD